jgi:hypothetical protein
MERLGKMPNRFFYAIRIDQEHNPITINESISRNCIALPLKINDPWSENLSEKHTALHQFPGFRIDLSLQRFLLPLGWSGPHVTKVIMRYANHCCSEYKVGVLSYRYLNCVYRHRCAGGRICGIGQKRFQRYRLSTATIILYHIFIFRFHLVPMVVQARYHEPCFWYAYFLLPEKSSVLSNSCGFAYFYTIDSVHTTHYSTSTLLQKTQFSIDSVSIINNSVTNNASTTQLYLYIRPAWQNWSPGHYNHFK